jgi:hypothetical protein
MFKQMLWGRSYLKLYLHNFIYYKDFAEASIIFILQMQKW